MRLGLDVIKANSFLGHWERGLVNFQHLKGPICSLLYRRLPTINEIFPNYQLHNRYRIILLYISNGYNNLEISDTLLFPKLKISYVFNFGQKFVRNEQCLQFLVINVYVLERPTCNTCVVMTSKHWFEFTPIFS